MALLEALSVATPAVVSPAVGRSIDVEGAGAGWIVGEGGLAPLLRRLHGEGRDELARRGRAARLMARRYDWKVVADRYEALYERAVGSDRRMTP